MAVPSCQAPTRRRAPGARAGGPRVRSADGLPDVGPLWDRLARQRRRQAHRGDRQWSSSPPPEEHRPCPDAGRRRHRRLLPRGAPVSRPPRDSPTRPWWPTAPSYDRAEARRRGLLGRAGPAARLVRRRGTRCSSGTCPSPGGSWAAPSTCRSTASTATSRAGLGRPGGLPLGGRAGRHPDDHLRRAAGRGRALRQRAQGPRGAARRPGGHLHAHDPRAAGGHAGLHPHRGRPLGRLRRVLARRPARPDQRRRRPRSSSPPTAAGAAARWSPLKENADAALADTPSIEHVVVARRTGDAGGPTPMTDGRDHWWDDLMAGAEPSCPPEHMDAEDLLYLLYTSGTTAKPKGIMHTTGGYLTQVAFTHRAVFDLHPERDVYWCAADIGWVTGHSYIVYGPLANGATSVHVRGHPRLPRQGPVVGHHRALRGDHPVLRAHRHPDVHEVGQRVPRAPRHVVAARARLGGRAHQPRGVGVVLDPHRRRPLPGGRHVVADRDGRHHDLARCPGSPPASRVRPPSPCPGIGAEVVDDAGAPVAARRRLPDPDPAVAVHAARHLRRSRALPRDLLEPLRGPLLRRRRRQARRRRATSGCSAGSTTS